MNTELALKIKAIDDALSALSMAVNVNQVAINQLKQLRGELLNGKN